MQATEKNYLQLEPSRRDFLKILGMGVTSMALISCGGNTDTSSNTVSNSSESRPDSLQATSIDTSIVLNTQPNVTEMPTLPNNNDQQLELLQKYEQETGVAARMMEFIGFPSDSTEAVALATSMATRLQEWHIKGVQPIVVMEPSLHNGQDLMDLEAFAGGTYDKSLITFFDTLNKQGVTNEMMGLWVPFPEPNNPGWANDITCPEIFTKNVSKVTKALKARFPNPSVSVMLDSQTSLLPDYSDSTKEPEALKQFLKFDPGLIESFGLQGFTWDNGDDPSTFLSSKAAVVGAKQLGVKHVWFNTGTYSAVNNPNGEGIIVASVERRAEVLKNILAQVEIVQNLGLSVDFINIFGEDKLDASPNGIGSANHSYKTPRDVSVLKAFVSDAKALNIPVTIFDTPR